MPCRNQLALEIKFENGPKQAVLMRRGEGGLLGIDRWVENLFVLKDDDAFYVTPGFNWDSITVISFALVAEPWDVHVPAQSGSFHIRNFVADSIGGWERVSELEELTIQKDKLEKIKNDAAGFILSRQTSTGLLTTWQEDGSSYLYGQGMALKILTMEGEWDDSNPQNGYAEGARKLARFLAENQEENGHWARSWDSHTGAVRSPYEAHDSTIWMGDFPWTIMGLRAYMNKSCDHTVEEALQKAEALLLSLIDHASGKFYTQNVPTGKRVEVTSAEAYAAAIGALLQMGEEDLAGKVIMQIDNRTWNNKLGYWHEAFYSSRVVLFANTWLSLLLYDRGYREQATNALSFAGKTLYTRGPGAPYGFDGIGPIATWFEGTLSYIAAGGPGSNEIMNNLLPFINKDGSVPHYNDNIGAAAAIWAEKWPSLDGTCWLYFVASKKSPFDIIDPADSCDPPVIVTYDVSLSANPPEGGTTFGAGNYNEGDTITVRAIAGGDYIFQRWTEQDSMVSTDEAYTFILNRPRELVAHFSKTTSSATLPTDMRHVILFSDQASETLTIGTVANEMIRQVQVFNMAGRKVMMVDHVDSHACHLQTAHWCTGVYVVKIITGKHVYAVKVYHGR